MRRKMITLFSLLIALIASADLADAETSETRNTATPQIRETSLCPSLPEGYQIIPASIKFSPDLRRVAYAAYAENTQNIIVTNGQISPVYYAIAPGLPIFSPDKNRLAYIAHKKKDHTTVVVDGKESEDYDIADNFIFSPDGSRHAFRAQKNDRQFVVIDGSPGPSCDGILIKNNFLFSPDSRHFFYAAYKNNACVAVIDGKENAESYTLIEDAAFSPDSKTYVYKARLEQKGMKEKWCVVKDGKPNAVYDKIFDIIFSYDSKQIAYAAIKEGQMVMVLNNQEIDISDYMGLPVFSWDSENFSYGLAKNNRWYIVANGKKSSAFDQIYKFQYSPDSKRYSYIAKSGKKWFCIVDGDKGPKFEVAIDILRFSPDSQRFAYAGVSQKGAQIISENQPSQKIYAAIGEPYFSPDSKHLVYRARPEPGGKWITVLDGKERYKAYHAIGKYTFSPDSKRLAVPVFESIDQTLMLVDGHEECADYKFKILGDPHFTPSGDYVIYHARAAEEKWHLVINGEVIPNAYGGFMKGTPIIFDDENRFHTLALRDPGPEFILIEGEIPDSFPKLSSGLN